MRSRITIAALSALVCGPALAESKVELKLVDAKGVGKSIGTVTLSETRYGVVLTPSLSGLPSGLHGFHLHEKPSCGPAEKDGKLTAAAAAGEHLDPAATKRHGLPWGDGHLGDLPPLFVDANGKAEQPVLAPRLKLSDLKGRALMVHVGGDNHADHPEPAGGGGERFACGVSP